MSYKSTNTKLEAEEDDADEEAEEANGETETDAETKAETEYEICSIFSSSSSCSSRVDGPSGGSCIQQPTAAATDCLLLQLERMAKKKLALAAIGKEKAEDAEKFTVGETANFKYRCYRSRSANQLSCMDREQSLELERKQVVKLELDRKLERERMRDRERAQERNRERLALQEQNQEELARERQWNEDNQLEMEHDYEYEQELELELELQLDQSDYPFLDLEQEPLQKQRTKRKQEHCGCIELREQLELRVREPVEDIQMEEQQAPHVASYPSKDQPEANNAQHKNKQENEELDEDVEVISRDGDESRPTTPYTYVNESPSDYRPGGYHPVSVGDSFQQRYFAISKLGWGHYSTVWLCYDTVRLCYCAIKLVKSAELYAESARHEIRLLRHISQLSWHPLRDRLVNLTDNFSTSGVNGTHQCLVFDVLGDNMLMLIQRSGYRGLPLYNVKQIAYQVLQGLYLLHDQGQLIHTDLKPENVLLVADDASLRTQATLESKKYLETHQQQLSQLDPNLSKTAKRRLRTKIKQSISFFQTHRKWLRERGISDLVQLAKHNLVTPKMAIDAVTNKLPYLAYDGPAILSSPDVCRLRLGGENSSAEQVGDTQTTTRRTRMRCSDMADNSSSGSGFDSPSLKPFKLLQDSTEKFLRYVQKCIEMEEQQKGEMSSEYHYSHNKRIKKKKSTAKRQADLPSPVPNSRCLNMSLIERKDPALEPCKLRVAIADVGNACFIDQHITEDIQTREYRAVEVILGAGYDTSADLWSAACLFWELATGEYLFEPNKWRGDASQDEVHVAHIIETCGPIPRDMIARGEYSADIFDSNGELLNIKHLEAHPLHQVLIERYNWSPRDAHEFADFLTPMLCTNPLRRITAFAAINHPWLLLHDMVDEDEQQDPSESNA